MTTVATHGVLQFVLSQVWAMEPGAHRRMMEIIMRHADGVKLADDEIVAATGKTLPERAVSMHIDDKTGVATIPIHGVIAHRAAAVGRVSSRVGTSVEHIRDDLQSALGNDKVTSIVIDVDSPGGSVGGITELGDEIRTAREQKPIVAHTDSMMASASYWLAAQADTIIATKTAEVGSIGVICAFMDGHRAAANQGYDPVVIKSTPAKGGMQSNGTLSDEDRADIQKSVDHYHGLFLEAVAAGRRVDAATAKAMGDGRVYIGAEAKQRGFIDSFGSMASAVKEAKTLARKREVAANAAAAAEETPMPDGDVPAGANNNDEVTMTTKIEPETKGATVPPTAPSPAPAPVPATGPSATQIAADATTAERERCLAILGSASEAQLEMAVECISKGTPLAQSLGQLNADLKDRLEAAKSLPSASTKSLAKGNTATVVAAGTEEARIKAMPEGEAKWQAEFDASKELQGEFGGDATLYFGWKRNEERLALQRGD